MYSQIWTHAVAGEIIRGCKISGVQFTTIGDLCWLIGRVVVNPGVVLPKQTVVSNESLVTRRGCWNLTQPGLMLQGSPARVIDNYSPWEELSLGHKMRMMRSWTTDFAQQQNASILVLDRGSALERIRIGDSASGLPYLVVRANVLWWLYSGLRAINPICSLFDVSTMTYTKHLTDLEVSFMRYLSDHKARFIPRTEEDDQC
jgi:hypothetical protein